jgi:hypothetical protein
MPASSGHETASLEETMAEMDDKELFSSAMTDDPTPETTEQPVERQEAPPQQDGRPRDEHGRFVAPRGAHEPEPQPEPQQPAAQQPDPARDEGAHVPSWRLREEREKAEAIERRYNDERMQWQRQLEMLQRQMPKPEPAPKPDWYENPDAANEYGTRQLLTPLEQRIQAMEERAQAQLEYNSRNYAFQQFGEQAVRSAYDWTANGIRTQDPEVVHAYNRAMQSPDPYGAMVQAYKRASIVQQIEAAGGPDKWREQQLASGQPQQQSRPQQSSQPQGRVNLPPSLRNTPSARSGNDDDSSDTSDAALFRQAMR